ncbi:MAG: alpha-glucan family phosphorylase [Candidatus Altiarchaeota archaeon]|nr:alpha-glucan family phosphorylase [Candidatus Altiarchaeota archaeon]
MKMLVSYEIGFSSPVKTYAGGLGILAGDILKAAADLKYPLVGLSFAYPAGYVRHELQDGKIVCLPEQYDISKHCKLFDTLTINTKAGQFELKIWKHESPQVYLIETELAQRVYIHDSDRQRLLSEIVLGKAAVELGERLGVEMYHLNESSTVFTALELHKRLGESAKNRLVFTTHTPLKHGHESWPTQLLQELYELPAELAQGEQTVLSELGTKLCKSVNAVSRMHQQVTHKMFPEWDIGYVTNGVHIPSWMHPDMMGLVKKICPDFGQQSEYSELELDMPDFLAVRKKTKQELVELINQQAIKKNKFSPDSILFGMARRMTPYKQLSLPLQFQSLLESGKDIQIVYAGRAHPADTAGIAIMENIIDKINNSKLKIALFPYYSIKLAQKMLAGSDVWLSIPAEKKEACGTSWMKAMINGTPVLNTGAGGIPEAVFDGYNGFIIPTGHKEEQGKQIAKEMAELSWLHHHEPNKFFDKGRMALKSAEFVSARRMVREYISLYEK